MEVLSVSNLNFQTPNYVSKDFNGMTNNMDMNNIPSRFDIQIGKEDLVLPQHVVHNIEIIVNDNSETATFLSDVTTDLPNNNLDPSSATTLTNENIVPVQLPLAPSPLVLPDKADNQHLTNSFPTSQEFKFKLPNNLTVASSKTPLLAKNLNVPFKENGEPPKKKFKGLGDNVASKSIKSPIRALPSLKKRKRMTRNKILSLKFRNDSPPDYILSFFWKYWPEMIIANPHQDLSKRFSNKGVFDCNSFNTANYSNNIDCTAPYDEVLQVLSAEKYALQNKVTVSQHYLTANQYNEAIYQYRYLCDQQSKVYNAIRQVIKLYGSFKHPHCNFDARYISSHRFTQAANVFPIIKSYKHFYGQA